MPSVTLNFKEISINNLTVFYREISPTVKINQSKTLIILHGWNQGGAETWQEIMGKLALQHPDYRIIAPDLPGMGESEQPKRIWNAEDYANCITNILEKLDIKKACLMGHSFGGAIASIIASQSPNLCSELILLAPAIVRPPLSSKQRLTKKITTFGKQNLEKVGLKKIVEKSRKVWYKLLGSSDYLKTEGIMKDIMAIVVREDLTSILPHIKCHTIIIWGKKDNYTPIWQLDIIRRQIPQNHVYMLEDINHGIHLYAKKVLYEILKKVLK